MQAASLNEVVIERLPVKLKRTDINFYRLGGNAPAHAEVTTHATQDEILADDWWSPVGDLLYVDDTVTVYFGPHPFDRQMATEPHYRGGAKPHDSLTIKVVGKEPVRHTRSGQITGWRLAIRMV